jgi:hypothetical protein
MSSRDRRVVHGDDGTVSGVWLMFMLIVVMAAAGLVFDGGRALQSERYASTVASGAARAGIASQTLVALESGWSGSPKAISNPDVARDAALRHAVAAGVPAGDVTVQVGDTEVRVTVTIRRQAVFTALAGQSEIVVRATGSARFTPTGGPVP